MDSDDEFSKQKDLIGFDSASEESQEEQVLDLDEEDEDQIYYEKIKANLKIPSSVEIEQDDQGWGKNKNAYYDGEDIEDEDDEEALRLQSLQADKFTEEDFLDDSFENLLNKDRNVKNVVDEHVKIKANVNNMSNREKDKLLKQTRPEVIENLELFKELLEDIDFEPASDLEKYVKYLKYLYLTNLSFKMAMLAKKDEMYKLHPVSDQLQLIGGLLAQAAEVSQELEEEYTDIEETPSEQDHDDLVIENDEEEEEELMDDQELEEEESEQDIEIPIEDYKPIDKKSKLSSLGKKYDAFGENEKLNDVDMNDKINTRKSLQYHVNRINYLDNSNIKSGDYDLPYKSKQAALQKEPQDIDPELESNEDEFVFDDMEKDEDLDYYNEIAAQKKTDKQSREEYYQDLYAPLESQYEQTKLDDSEKRKADYKILTNKGLTPHRKKEVRNPRVKHRKKYEKAQKKLSSYRRVAVDRKQLKSYQGETTGIKRDLSRSIKF